MPAVCVRTTRPATDAERARLRSRASLRGAIGCLSVLAVPLIVVGVAAGVRFGWTLAAVVILAGALAVGVFARSFIADGRRSREWLRQDAANGSVEVLTITSATPLAIPATHSSVDPAFALELDDGRTLVLLGQWLASPETFGGRSADLEDDDAGDAYANALPPPYAFPTSAFTVHRFPLSGEVVRIELAGDYVAPADLGGHLDLTPVNDSPSFIVDAPPSRLAEVLPGRR